MAKLAVPYFLLASIVLSGGYVIVKTYETLSEGEVLSVQSLRDLPLFAWHPILMCVAWLFLAPVSWSIILSRRTVLKKDKRTIITQLHAASIFLGVVSAALAGYAIYTNKERAGKEHFTTPHAKIGAAFWAFILISYASAFYNVLDFKGKTVPNFNWSSKIHKYLGKATFVASGLAISTGLYSRWGKQTFEDEKIRAALALGILIPQILIAIEVPGGNSGGKVKK